METKELLNKSRSGDVLAKEELVYLLGLEPGSVDSYMVMAEAARLSKELSNGKAEVHAQFAVNLAPCNCECLFCSFANTNGIFKESTELAPEQAAGYAARFEADGANAVYLMSTAQFPFSRFIEIGQEVRKKLKPDTTLVANVGDQSLENAVRLKEAGFAGVYHALRLREGRDTTLSVEKRKQSIHDFTEAGLKIGTCVEPVGPEHTNEELAEMIEFTASFDPAYSGSARRIPIEGTEMGDRGMISELRMAQIVAVTRLRMPRSVIGHCTHEPCTLGAIAGANFFWAEAGANPRDTEANTEEGRGDNVSDCKSLFFESNWDAYSGPSRYFEKSD